MQGIGTAVEIGKLAWENRTEIRKALSLVRRWFRSRVLVIGPGGTGKTTLARILSGEFDWLLDEPWEYKESYAVERFRLKNVPVEAIVAPGQKGRRGATWQAVGSDLAAGKYRGVILVSAYGHHSLTDVGLKAAKPGLPKERALREYLEEARADELTILRQLGDLIRACPKKLWVLSVVTKQDLWFPEDPAVRKHYREGEYAGLIRQVVEHRGVERFRHEFAFVSLVISNYLTPQGERLKKNVEGYDHKAQIESIRRLFDVLDGLRKWEAGS